jgi:hypothetical protein
MTLWALIVRAQAADAHLDAITGVRTAPDAALEHPVEWQPEFEPTVVGALMGGVLASRGKWWGSLEGAAWGVLPELDGVLFSAGARGGAGLEAGDLRLEVAGRYDLQSYPFARPATSGRAEGFALTSLSLGAWVPELSLEAIDRRYPFEPDWSFTTAESAVGLAWRPERGWARVALGGQVNQGADDLGTQLRATAELGWGAARWDLFTRYRLMDARAGDPDDASRSRFTPLGDYSADADALSAGGFVQHRLELGGSAEAGEWLLRASALGRLRLTGAQGAYDRTLHAQLDLERELSERVSAVGTLGSSAVGLVGGKGFLDVYAWAGLSWRP